MLEERVDQWREDIQRDATRKGLQQGLEQGLEQGIEKGIQQGMEQGFRKAQITLLGKQAEQRFGPLGAAHRQQLASFSAAQLDALCLRVLTAQSLEELFQAA